MPRLTNRTFDSGKQKRVKRVVQQRQGSNLRLTSRDGPIIYSGFQKPTSNEASKVELLTSMEKKILKKLKETTRSKGDVKPINFPVGGLKMAKKVYI